MKIHVFNKCISKEVSSVQVSIDIHRSTGSIEGKMKLINQLQDILTVCIECESESELKTKLPPLESYAVRMHSVSNAINQHVDPIQTSRTGRVI